MAMSVPKVTIAKWLPRKDFFESELTPVAVTVEPPTGVVRTPSDICCVIDISGSMSDEAKIQGAGRAAESQFTLLDIAKHGVKTVTHTLGPDDRLSLVLFNHQAEVVFELLEMTEEGKKKAEEKLDEVNSGGGTNIWEGLYQGLEVLRKGVKPGRLGHIMLLTDGQTTHRSTVMENLAKYKQDYEHLPGTISTFGFGYSIDSELLDQISSFGMATYSFIPDAGFVGTVFINTLSNLLCTMGMRAQISLEITNCKLVKVLGDQRVDDTKDFTIVDLGTLQYDQTRTIVLAFDEVKASSEICANVTFADIDGSFVSSSPAEAALEQLEPDKAALVEYWRTCYIDTVIECMSFAKRQRMKEAMELMMNLSQMVSASPAADDERTKALLQDIGGQSSEALLRADWFDKWGVHYLPSIKFAHRVQQCNNFKDPSVQLYGGKLFKEVQEKADDIFNKLPAPKPSKRPTSASHRTGGGPAAPVSMSQYNDRYGVCIDSSCSVQLADGSRSTVGLLTKGMPVVTPGGRPAEVICVLHRVCEGGVANLVELKTGVRVTPFHPVFVDGEWRFPVELGQPQEFTCEAVCSVLLEGVPALLVGEEEPVPCVCLAHHIEEGAAKHDYFGSDKVLDDLRGFPGFASGLIDILPGDAVRDPTTGNVCRLRRTA